MLPLLPKGRSHEEQLLLKVPKHPGIGVLGLASMDRCKHYVYNLELAFAFPPSLANESLAHITLFMLFLLLL